jgi:flagellar motor switch protein FliM
MGDKRSGVLSQEKIDMIVSILTGKTVGREYLISEEQADELIEMLKDVKMPAKEEVKQRGFLSQDEINSLLKGMCDDDETEETEWLGEKKETTEEGNVEGRKIVVELINGSRLVYGLKEARIKIKKNKVKIRTNKVVGDMVIGVNKVKSIKIEDI